MEFDQCTERIDNCVSICGCFTGHYILGRIFRQTRAQIDLSCWLQVPHIIIVVVVVVVVVEEVIKLNLGIKQ